MPDDDHPIRDGRDSDSERLIALIRDVYAEYPGCVLDVDGEEPHLRRPASAFAAWGGQLWVAESAEEVVGCIGYADQGKAIQLKHLYVAPTARRNGLGSRLVGLAEEAARSRGRTQIELWTDTRFADAHRLYERLGYVRSAGARELLDLSRSVEYHYRKLL